MKTHLQFSIATPDAWNAHYKIQLHRIRFVLSGAKSKQADDDVNAKKQLAVNERGQPTKKMSLSAPSVDAAIFGLLIPSWPDRTINEAGMVWSGRTIKHTK